jgi:hypothetical protein
MTSWHVTVSVPRSDGGCIGPALGKPAARALVKAARSDPALSGVTATAMIRPCDFGQPPEPDVLAVEVTVAAGYPVLVVSKVWATVNDALGKDEGWDLKCASISMRPLADGLAAHNDA